VGLLEAYAMENCKNPSELKFLPSIFAREPVQAIVDRLIDAELIGFSTYVWNIKLSLAVAKRLKELRPDVLIVFGGPQVPDHSLAFLEENRFVDLCVHGEGEVVFRDLIDAFVPGSWTSKDWFEIPSTSFLHNGEFVQVPRAARLRDLNVLPSPFLNGIFDRLMEANPNQNWLALWETNRGCPFNCTFCDWGSATQAKVFQFELERLSKEIEWFSTRKIEFIFCCDANFGILPRDLEIAKLVAEVKNRNGYPQALSVQNTKNATERAYQVQKTLADSGLNKGVTLSMQSLDPHTLKSIKRDNISLASYYELQKRFTRDRIETYSDMILGLPGETYQSFVDGVSSLVTNGQHNRIQFNNCTILPNAEMAAPAYRELHEIETVTVPLVNIHGSLVESIDAIQESQEMIIGTKTTPREDWVKTRAFGWMTALVHFDKVLQIPIVLTHCLAGINYKDIFLEFCDLQSDRYPVISSLQQFFRKEAQAIQAGGAEYVKSEDWLNIYWPADEYALIKMVRDDQLEAFYAECLSILTDILGRNGKTFPEGLLQQAVELNSALLKRPFVSNDLEITLDYNLWEIYAAALVGDTVELRTGKWTHKINRSAQTWNTWNDWCKEVIWWGNKKGAYLYGNSATELQMEGHF
jgi:tRNA A37 methylthiotransferase MiaB